MSYNYHHTPPSFLSLTVSEILVIHWNLLFDSCSSLINFSSHPSMEDSHSPYPHYQHHSDNATPQDHAADGSGSTNGAKYRLMSPAKLPISRSPCITIPPGLSPTSFLESPVLLSNIKAEPSPTTGSFFKSQLMQGSGENAALLLEKKFSSGNTVDGRTSFEFRFHTGANSTSGLSSIGMSIPMGLNRNGPGIHQDQRYSQSLAVSAHDSSIYNTIDELNQGGQSNAGIQASSSDHKDTTSSVSADRTSDDGYNWRKYGQKLVKGSEFPRSYYKCTFPNCEVKKIFERSPSGQITEIVYKGSHEHPKPQSSRRNNPGALMSIPEDKMDKGSSFTGQEGKLNSNNMEQNGSPVLSPLQANEEGIDGSGSQYQGTNDEVEEDDPFLKRRYVFLEVITVCLLLFYNLHWRTFWAGKWRMVLMLHQLLSLFVSHELLFKL
ncbi:hypothetical protein ACS0TY_033399 [Phlomoides rotata]